MILAEGRRQVRTVYRHVSGLLQSNSMLVRPSIDPTPVCIIQAKDFCESGGRAGMDKDEESSTSRDSSTDKAQELSHILEEHAKWLASSERRGTRADLSRANLDGMDLSLADLGGAILHGTSLDDANLRGADLTHADLTDASLKRAVLEGADVLLTDFTGADLSNANLRKTTSSSKKELGHIRRGPSFQNAVLRGAQLQGSYCVRSDFSGSQLSGADFEGADLRGADFSSNDLSEARFYGANLARANLQNSRLHGTDLRGSCLINADLSQADMSEADVSAANLQSANLADTKVDRIRYNRKCRFQGIRVSSCYGSSRFRRFAQDQSFIEEFREAYPALYWVWLMLTDCGRSMLRVVLWSIGFIVLFAFLYLALGEQSFNVANKATLGWNFFTVLYASTANFASLGYGDVLPLTRLATIVVMSEVVVGYVMLGILISILATKVARRS